MTTIRYSPVTHVIFDLDGTLVDTEDIIHKIMSDIVTKTYEKEYPANIRHFTAGQTMVNTANIVIKQCELNCDTIEFIAAVDLVARHYLSECKLKPGAERLVKHFYMHDIPICVATSSDMESVMLKSTNHRSLFSLFHHITTAAKNPEVKYSKPEPDVFLVAASKFEEHPRPYKCLVFEDAYLGVLGGRRAGMQVVMIPDPSLPEDDTFMATKVLPSMLYFEPEMFGLPSFEP
ncbi:pseudouridine-5'-phosphatase-like [Chrysoperla carnea]|uniref:pseudouridine-5'-phosphatase-like n=1 Tax=Chrysoperla carnea TaxID=189513 RepID=UPI001D078308|nr:pseudouridine-5'-phosphatase-like [Chrysoperla carnea]